MYNFIDNLEQIRATERLFIQDHSESVFTLYLAYHYNKNNNKEHDTTTWPQKNSWYGTVIYPTKTTIPGILEQTITKHFHRPKSDLPEDAFAIYLTPDPKNSQIIKSSEMPQDTFMKELDRQRNLKWFHVKTESRECEVFEYLRPVLKKYRIIPIFIDTHNGFHFLIDMNHLQWKHYKDIYQDILEKCPDIKIEFTTRQGVKQVRKTKMFKNHSGARIPVPGTLQYGFDVELHEYIETPDYIPNPHIKGQYWLDSSWYPILWSDTTDESLKRHALEWKEKTKDMTDEELDAMLFEV